MDYRTATLEDAEAIGSLWTACGLGNGAADAIEIAERLRNDDGFFIVGTRNDGGIVASAMGCYDNHRGWVKRVAVSPQAQGQGAGTELVAELERRFRTAGITELRLAVFRDNASAGQFWETKGYEELTNVRYFVKSLKPYVAIGRRTR